MGIYPDDKAPFIAPELPYFPAADTVIVRYNNQQSIIQEIFRRENGTFGLRYRAWINHPDGKNKVRHVWQEIMPKSNLITRSTESAKQMAEFHASEKGILFGDWITTWIIFHAALIGFFQNRRPNIISAGLTSLKKNLFSRKHACITLRFWIT